MVMLLLLLLSHFSRVQLCATPETAAHQAPWSWNSSGKNTGAGCRFLLQCMKVKSESEVVQLCPTPSNPIDLGLPGSSIHGICQARVLVISSVQFSSVAQSYLTLQPHESQHARPPCPSPTPRVHSESRPSSQ